jgi:DNA-binding NarL/FixJ family response regulator
MTTVLKHIPNLIIVDDHQIFRQCLQSLLSDGSLANVIGEASNGNDFMELLIRLKPDIVLMDIDMPFMNGIEATLKALEFMPDLKIIVFSMFGNEEYYRKMIDCGVKGFILKSSGFNELENAIETVMMGHNYFSNELLRKIINNFGHKIASKSLENHDLTVRESEILQNIFLCLTTDEIALKLNISPKTVKSHRSNLLEKTYCKNTPQLILYALKHKMITL